MIKITDIRTMDVNIDAMDLKKFLSSEEASIIPDNALVLMQGDIAYLSVKLRIHWSPHGLPLFFLGLIESFRDEFKTFKQIKDEANENIHG